MNDKFQKIITITRKNANLITLGISIIVATLTIVNYFATANIRISQIASAETKVEQDLKANTDQHKEFVTQTDFKVSINAIQDIVDQVNQTTRSTNIMVNQLLLRK
jgi:hypothetical protein